MRLHTCGDCGKSYKNQAGENLCADCLEPETAEENNKEDKQKALLAVGGRRQNYVTAEDDQELLRLFR